MFKIVHPVYGDGIQTLDIQDMNVMSEEEFQNLHENFFITWLFCFPTSRLVATLRVKAQRRIFRQVPILLTLKYCNIFFHFSCTAFQYSGKRCELFTVDPYSYVVVDKHTDPNVKTLMRDNLFHNWLNQRIDCLNKDCTWKQLDSGYFIMKMNCNVCWFDSVLK